MSRHDPTHTPQSRPEQDEAVRLHKYLHDEGVWPDEDEAWHQRICEGALATPPPVPTHSESDYDSTIVQGYQADPIPPPVPAAPPLDVEQAFVKGWFAALLYAIHEGGDPTSSEEARRQAAEYARLSPEKKDSHE